jgi:hypothetical protein
MEIEDFYGTRCAKRSGVPLMNHINEGTKLLEHLGASADCIRAYHIHPIYQDSLGERFIELLQENGPVIALVVSYTQTANASLSDIVAWGWYGDGPHNDYRLPYLRRPIVLSDIPEVNLMLVADKCQNYKDFIKYHYGTHVRSDELDFYFSEWLKALGVSDAQFNYYRELMSSGV